MKEYLENGIKVIEYAFEDWAEGAISGNWKSGRTLIENVNTKEKYFGYLPTNEFERIEAKQKQIYQTQIAKEFSDLKNSFEKLYNQSGDKDRLLQSEISKFEFLLYPEKLAITSNNNIDFPIPGLPFDTIRINYLRKIYQKIVVKGEKEYHFIDGPNSKVKAKSSLNIMVEAIAKYLQWLREFQDLKELSKDELFQKIIKGLGVIIIKGSDKEVLDQVDTNLLDTYLATYYNLSNKVRVAKTITEAIVNLKALVLFYKEQARRPKVVDVSQRNEAGKISYGWIVRDTKIDDWINTKILLPVEDKIARLQELKDVYPEDSLGNSSLKNLVSKVPLGFEQYLNQRGVAISDHLKSSYQNAKPQIIAFMLFALDELKLLNPGTLSNNITELHSALTLTFGKIGTRQSITNNLSKLRSPDSYQKAQIRSHKTEIQKAAKK